MLANGGEELPFMIYIRQQIATASVNESTPVNHIVREWVELIRRGGSPELFLLVLLVFDSYYLDNTTRIWLREERQKFIASAKPCNFGELQDRVKQFVTKPGEYKGIWREIPDFPDFQETYVHVWDKNQKIGEKSVLSNALTKENKRGDKFTVPIYDDYSHLFNMCDLFNGKLKDRKWPHRAGGGSTMSDPGTQDTFAFACILQNTFNAYRSMNRINIENYNFEIYCCQLATDLFAYADALH